jgi:hypothetical protein
VGWASEDHRLAGWGDPALSIDQTPGHARGLLEHGSTGMAFGFPNILLVKRQSPMVSVTRAPDDRDPKFVIADGRGAGPAAAVCY